MKKISIIAAALALGVPAAAYAADCCKGMACCKDGTKCCEEKDKGGKSCCDEKKHHDHAGQGGPDTPRN
jgi:hypothetical protein